MADQVRVQFAENGKQTNVRPGVVNRKDFAGALKMAGNKLRIKAKRLFSKDGEELTAQDFLDPEIVCLEYLPHALFDSLSTAGIKI
jgi:hypothetical protein